MDKRSRQRLARCSPLQTPRQLASDPLSLKKTIQQARLSSIAVSFRASLSTVGSALSVARVSQISSKGAVQDNEGARRQLQEDKGEDLGEDDRDRARGRQSPAAKQRTPSASSSAPHSLADRHASLVRAHAGSARGQWRVSPVAARLRAAAAAPSSAEAHTHRPLTAAFSL